nr:enoyl-CoA hydratase [Xanthomonadales bacterium]NIX12521.1 enoyl-CoA hydratase [Xanthomonadales bacterium]
SQQLEFLAPVFVGDTITAVVEVTSWRPEKRIITFKTDAYNQEEIQVVTGQSVLMVE